ncbi:MAG: cation:proton antiporter [Betaproteobacteria bacterium]|nr:cation:proton antiporter [Betaproteobacteria bacterium]MBK7081872.1 cation:proton antiporter [Betaproteobacteria bacterium]MBK8689014.1 cation:proton antiporter [Betaproteobacteria bacterium]MBK9675153.1 cation:proton antiporter [Betaproteobacteria bacterium]MBL0289617.1 cation:proton antiporter [Betaproteobacteria bacterium]
MPHDVTLIATFALGFALAFVFGYFANRLRLPPLVGYLLAGVVIGTFTPDFVASSAIAGQLAEIGVILLMFGVGLHFSVDDLMAVRRIVFPGAFAQIVIATAIGTGMAMLWGWSLGGGLVLGLCLSVASTVVLLKALEERNAVATLNGRIAVGWLIVEDLAMVLVLVLLPALAGMLGGNVPGGGHGAPEHGLLLTLAITLAKVAAFGAIVLLVGPRVLPWILRQVARTGSRELFTLAILSLSVGIAFGAAELFGVSFALGAFFAGVVLNESDLSHKAATNSLPLQDAFAVLFFVSVGMLFDPSIVIREPLMLAAVLLLILVGKSLIALAVVLLLGYPLSTALMVSAALAQIGEFSFILAGLGIGYGLLPPEGLSLILAGAILSITFNKFAFLGADWLNGWVQAGPERKRICEDSRGAKLGLLHAELDAAHERAEAKAAARKTLSPDELVQRFPVFAQLTPEQREVVILHFLPQSAQPGERIIRMGDKADAAYFISSGEVEVSVSGRRIHLGPGNFFGEMALISGQPRSAHVTALDYCSLLKLTTRDFKEIMDRYPEIREQVRELAAQRGEMNRQPSAEPAPGDSRTG